MFGFQLYFCFISLPPALDVWEWYEVGVVGWVGGRSLDDRMDSACFVAAVGIFLWYLFTNTRPVCVCVCVCSSKDGEVAWPHYHNT